MTKTRETVTRSSKKARSSQDPDQRPADSATLAGTREPDALQKSDESVPGAESAKPADEIDRLATMKIGELQALLAELTGEKTRCPNRAYLVRRVMEAAVPIAPESASVETVVAAAGVVRPEPLVAQEPEGGAPIEEAAYVPEVDPATTTGTLDANPTAVAASAEPEAASASSIPLSKLSKLDVPALRALYAEAVGRETQSSNAAYLQWKIRQAQTGKVPVGPRQRHQKAGDAVMVLPLRMEADVVDKLDDVWRRQGLRSRMELFRRALQSYLAGVGEHDVAALLASEA